MNLIKKNLNDLGIEHDNFISETNIVNNKEVEKVVEKLKKTNMYIMVKLNPPKVKIRIIGLKGNNYYLDLLILETIKIGHYRKVT